MSKFLLLFYLCSVLFVFLTVYTSASLIDFGGLTDPSLVIIVLILINGIKKRNILPISLILLFYISFTDYFSLIEVFSKLLLVFLFIKYVKNFLWQSFRNDIFLILACLSICYFISFIIYSIGFGVDIGSYLEFIIYPMIFNFFISTILLIIIKYNSWPKIQDQVYRF